MAKVKDKKDKKRKVETVEERREKVLAQGRKFKYPLQHAKYKVMIYTIVIAVVALVAMVTTGWVLLYKAQDTGDLAYRVTTIVPLPVAEVDGQAVRYSDYLMIYRSSMTTIEQQSGKLGEDEDAAALRDSYKRAALNAAEEYAFAEKLAKEMGVTVSDQEVADSLTEHLNIGGAEQSEEGFLKIIRDNFGLSRDEYERMLYLTLIKAKVTAEIDENAQKTADKIEALLAEKEGDLSAVAAELGEAVEYEETGGLVDAKNIDGGRATAAMDLSEGQVSERFSSSNGDGYYFVKLIKKTDTQVNYVSVKVKFTTFAEMMQNLRENGGIKEFISVPEE